MLNSDLVMQAAADFAAAILSRERHGRASASHGCMPALTVGRLRQQKSPRNQAFLACESTVRSAPARPIATQRRQKAWSILCQTILAANEFMYVQ